MVILKQIRSLSFGVCAFVLCASTLSAGSVTYDFIEGTQSPNPGIIGAFIVFASPPASATSGWMTSNTADVLDIEVTDPKISPVSTFQPISAVVRSLHGSELDSGNVFGQSASGDQIIINFLPSPAEDQLFVNASEITGNFIMASVPEPSSLLLACTAALAGLGFWKRRRDR